jgi:hypothetical protein
VQEQPRATTDAAESVLALSRFTDQSLQELLVLLREFERADAAATQPGPRPADEQQDSKS